MGGNQKPMYGRRYVIEFLCLVSESLSPISASSVFVNEEATLLKEGKNPFLTVFRFSPFEF